MPIALFWESNDKVYSCEETVSTDCREENGPVLDTKHIAEKRMCLWACPGHETYEAFLQGHDAIWYQSPKGKAGQWVCFWHQSWREEGGNDPVLGIKQMTYFVRGYSTIWYQSSKRKTDQWPCLGDQSLRGEGANRSVLGTK